MKPSCPTNPCNLPSCELQIDGECQGGENRFVAEDGTVYVASGSNYTACSECDIFINMMPCPNSPSCVDTYRTDKRNIVWKREPFNKGVK
jgi:hypothetical protein